MRKLFLDSRADPPLLLKGINAALALLLLSLLLFLAFSVLDYSWDWNSVYDYRSKLLQGWFMTLAISMATLLLSLVIGLLAALSQRSSLLPLRYLSWLYVTLIRGTPLLVQIIVFFYVIADAAGIDNRYLAGIAIMSVFSGAYISEIIRAGIESVGSSQLMSAKGIGFTSLQTYRYVVMPQAMRRSLPALTGQFANLIKDSSLLSVVAISEFTLNAQEINALTYSVFESFIPLAIGYLVLTLPIMHFSSKLEKRLQFDT